MPTYLETIFNFESLIKLVTLTATEIVLGIDNVIFISIISNKLLPEKQQKARVIGLSLALVFRIGLLFTINKIVGMNEALITIRGLELSGHELILLAGGLFLIYKSSSEIIEKFYESEKIKEGEQNNKMLGLTSAVVQIILLDIVFSFDSILTAVGLIRELVIMIAAVIISLFIMLYFSKPISDYVNNHPNIKILALSFLVMIGIMLTLEGLSFEELIPKESVYVAMVFALIVELLNMKLRAKTNQSLTKENTLHSLKDNS